MNTILPEESLAKKLITKWFWLYFFTYLIAPSGYVIKLLVSNSLSVEEVWLLYSLMWLVWIFSAYNDLGLTEALTYFVPKFLVEWKKNYITTSIFFSFIVQFLVWLFFVWFLYFGAERLVLKYFYRYICSVYTPILIQTIQVFAVYFLFSNALNVLQTVFVAFQKIFITKLIETIRMWTIVFWTVYLWYIQDSTLLSYSNMWILWTVIWCSFIVYFFVKDILPHLKNTHLTLNKKYVKMYSSYALWTLLSTNVWTTLWQVDQQMVLYRLWAESSGLYTVYLSTFQIPILILWPIFALIIPVVSQLFTQKNNATLSLFLQYLITYIWWLSILISICLMALAPFIVNILFWEEFAVSWELLIFWSLMIPIVFFINIAASYISWVWMAKYKLKVFSFCFVINIILNIVFLSFMWIYWPVLATLLSNVFMTIWFLYKMPIRTWLVKNRSFIIKNILLGLIFFLWTIIWWKDILNSWASRIHNVYMLSIFIIILWIIFVIIQYKEIVFLYKEIKNIRNADVIL